MDALKKRCRAIAKQMLVPEDLEDDEGKVFAITLRDRNNEFLMDDQSFHGKEQRNALLRLMRGTFARELEAICKENIL